MTATGVRIRRGHPKIIVPSALADDPLLDADDQPGNDPAHQADEADRLDPRQHPAEQIVSTLMLGSLQRMNHIERYNASRARSAARGLAPALRARRAFDLRPEQMAKRMRTSST